MWVKTRLFHLSPNGGTDLTITLGNQKAVTAMSWLSRALALCACLVLPAPRAAVADDWTPRNGPEGGYVASIAVDYTDSNIVYLSNNAGIHKSTNGGASWTNLNAYFGTYKIVLDPTNHNTVYLVGYLVSGIVVRSTDAGANWVILDTKLPCNDFPFVGAKWVIKDLVVDFKSPSTLYGIAHEGEAFSYYVIKSTNSGDSWETLTWPASTLAVDPTNSSVLYAVFSGSDRPPFLQKSIDGGGTWNPAGTGLPTGGTFWERWWWIPRPRTICTWR